jgi:putative transposase
MRRPERQRKPTRLRGHDYASPGWYVVTICAQDRALLFAEVVNGAVHLNDAGLMIESWWTALPLKFPGVALDAHVVMPNHLHGIVIIQDPLDLRLEADFDADFVRRGVSLYAGAGDRPDVPNAPVPKPGGHAGPPLHGTGASGPIDDERGQASLTDAIGWFKTMTTNEYIRGVKTLNWEPFNVRLWQRSFYDTMIRSDRHLACARAYIESNPFNWHTDDENPSPNLT